MPFPSALILLLSLLAAAAPAAALAQVYKWVDENGVVNYGDKPPARGKPAKPLAENGGSVSVVPGMPKEELEQMRQRDMQRRVQQLENEVDELRARSMARDNAAAYPMPAEVYVPAAYGYDYGYGWGYGRRALYPPVARRPGPRPEHPIANPPPNRGRSFRGSPMEPVPNSVGRGAPSRG
jgi:hypothetical protein